MPCKQANVSGRRRRRRGPRRQTFRPAVTALEERHLPHSGHQKRGGGFFSFLHWTSFCALPATRKFCRDIPVTLPCATGRGALPLVGGQPRNGRGLFPSRVHRCRTLPVPGVSA